MYTFIQKDYPKTRGLLQNKCKRVKQNISFSWKAITGVIENNEISTCSFLENFQKQKQYYFFYKKHLTCIDIYTSMLHMFILHR